MKNEQQSQNLLLKVDPRSIFRENLFMLRDKWITQGVKRVVCEFDEKRASNKVIICFSK